MPRSDIDAIDRRVSALKNRDPKEGRIVSVEGRIAKVRPKGSSLLRAVYCDESRSVEPGKRCIFQWLPESKKYVMLTVFSDNNSTDNYLRSKYELFPPGGVQVVSGILPSAFEMRWNTPPQQPVTFEVESNTSVSEIGTTARGTTRAGGMLIYTNNPLYVRVRSIAENFQKSAWSTWLLGTPGSASGVTGITGDCCGVEDFTDLGDVPSAYTGHANKVVAVKGDESGLEFITPPVTGAEDFTDLGDVPSAYTGHGSKLVAVKGDESGLEFVTAPSGGGIASVVGGTGISIDNTDPDNPIINSTAPGLDPNINDPPDATDFTEVNFNTEADLTDAWNGLNFHCESASGDHIRKFVMSASAPYDLKTKILYQAIDTDYTRFGIGCRESGSGKQMFCGHAHVGSSGFELSKWNDDSYDGNEALQTLPSWGGYELWLRVQNDGTNRIFSYSRDGEWWLPFFTNDDDYYLTEDQVGFFTNHQNGYDLNVRVLSWELT